MLRDIVFGMDRAVRFFSSVTVLTIVVVGRMPQAAAQEQSDARRVEETAEETRGANGKPPLEDSPDATPAEPAEAEWARVRKEDLRYGGRGFAEWRRQLLTDLEPKTQLEAIEALEAFGVKGYEQEAATVLARVLASKSDQVRWRAFTALAGIGPVSAPVLLEALRSDNPQVRGSAAAALAQIGSAAEAALDPLRQAIQDEDRSVRLTAARGLAKLGANEKRLLPMFEQLARSADVEMRRAIVWGLSESGGKNARLLPLFLRELDDGDWQTREAAGKALIHYGPADREVIDGLKQLAREDIARVRVRQRFDATVGGFVRALGREEKNLGTVAPVLIEAASILLTDPAFGQWPMVGEVLTGLSRLGPKAVDAVPALAQFIALGSPAGDEYILLAIDILRLIGPPAREAISALDAWVAQPDGSNRDLQSIQKHALKALRSIKN